MVIYTINNLAVKGESKDEAGGFAIRSLNRRNSPQERLLVSADLTTDAIAATGGHRRFVPLYP